jgi:hypothetical protein
MTPTSPDLTARNFPSAEEAAAQQGRPSLYGGPESAYRLAFTDTAFLLREELRPVRMQLELLKPELVQQEQGIESTIVIFGSARIKPPDEAAQALADAQASGDTAAVRRAQTAVAMSHYYDEARRFSALATKRAGSTTRRCTWSPAAAPASWKPATAARTTWAARASG